MQGARIQRILLKVSGDILIETYEPLVTLLPLRPNPQWVVVGPVGFVVDECGLELSAPVSRMPVVIRTTIEELSMSIGERL